MSIIIDCQAVVVLKGDSQATGTVTFEQQKNGVVTVTGELRNLDPLASRGFHIQYVPLILLPWSHYPLDLFSQFGDLTNGCLSAGPHFNPFSKVRALAVS
jgi:Cu-Zn family superoxide dismutase